MHPLFPARRSSDLTNCYAYSLQEQHKFVPLIIGACDVMAATEIKPFDLAKKRTDERFHCCPGPAERQKILLAKRVEMQARNALQLRSAKLDDRRAQTAMGLAGTIFLDCTFDDSRLDAKKTEKK